MSTIENWETDVKNEIEELHEFFQNWFNGTIGKDEFNRFTDVMSEEFQIISPSGDIQGRETLIKRLEEVYGKNKSIKIRVDNISVAKLSEVHILAIYDEIQDDKDRNTVRISTAIFSLNTKLPNHYWWVHVHETWK